MPRNPAPTPPADDPPQVLGIEDPPFDATSKGDEPLELPHERLPEPGESNPTDIPSEPWVDRNHDEARHFLRVSADRIRNIPESVEHNLSGVLKAIEKALGED